MNIYIGAVGSLQSAKTLLPAKGRNISEATRELRRTTQLSSGRRVVDIIATKKVFTFSYRVITGPDIDTWLSFAGSDTWEIEVQRRSGSYDKYSVRFSEEFYILYTKTVGDWYHENVYFTLEEI